MGSILTRIAAAALLLVAACSPSPSASAAQLASPASTVNAHTFNDGELHVGTDVLPGTYRVVRPPSSDPEDFCYWERVSGFGGSSAETIGNSAGVGPRVATIDPSDAGFISQHCGTWTSDLSPLPVPIDDGVWIVGVDVQPGHYTSQGGTACVWQRLSGFGGTSDESTEVGSVGSVEIIPTDKGFSSSHCGTWLPG